MGQNAEWMLKAWKERGQEPPLSFQREMDDGAARADAPELSWLEQQYLLLFNAASSCRPAAFNGFLPLPYLTMREVIRQEGWSGVEADNALYVLRKMDEETMRIWAAELDKHSSDSNRSSGHG